MDTQPKLRKKTFTITEQAIHQVRGFRKLYEELDDKVRLSGHSESTMKNYSRKLAHLALHCGKLPQHISEKELNKYLTRLYRSADTMHTIETLLPGRPSPDLIIAKQKSIFKITAL